MKQNPNSKLTLLSLSRTLPLLLLFAPLSLSTPINGAVGDLDQTAPSSAPAPHSRLQGRPGWNPLWGLGPVIPPAGSLDNVPVNNDPEENLNTDVDPPADTDTDTDTNTNMGADLESTNTSSSNSNANANAASDGGDTQAENQDVNNASAN